MQKGILYIVATPIGNLADISLRAIEVLKKVNLIAAEDTRHSRHLLNHYEISTPIISLHEFNEKKRCELLLAKLQSGQDIALISDAGTPLISDPGFFLVNELHQNDIKVMSVPGPCAAIAGLVISGLPTDRFVFEGFLPAKGKARQNRLQELTQESRTIIFYEAPHRILDFLANLIQVFGKNRRAAIARELTKTYETLMSGSLEDLETKILADKNQQKGEFVIILQGIEISADEKQAQESERILQLLLAELPLKQAVDLTVKITHGSKRALYQRALQIKNSTQGV